MYLFPEPAEAAHVLTAPFKHLPIGHNLTHTSAYRKSLYSAASTGCRVTTNPQSAQAESQYHERMRRTASPYLPKALVCTRRGGNVGSLAGCCYYYTSKWRGGSAVSQSSEWMGWARDRVTRWCPCQGAMGICTCDWESVHHAELLCDRLRWWLIGSMCVPAGQV